MTQGSATDSVAQCELATRHMRLAGLERPGSGPVRLALHGWLDNAASFLPLMAQTPGHWLALDLPGHGWSDHLPAGQRYHFSDVVATLSEAIEQGGWRDLVLVGHSLGGALAIWLAVCLPERVRALVLLDASGPLSETEAETARRVQRANREFIDFDRHLHRVYATPEDALEARLRASQITSDSARCLVERNLLATDFGWQWRYDPRWRLPSPVYFSEPQVQAVLAAVPCPTLWLEARQGLLQRRAESAARFACLSRAERRLCAGFHHAHMDEAQAVAEHIESWLAQLSL